MVFKEHSCCYVIGKGFMESDKRYEYKPKQNHKEKYSMTTIGPRIAEKKKSDHFY